MIVSTICDLIRDRTRLSEDERSDTDLLAVVNAAYHDVCGMRLWKWREAITQCITVAPYNTGTALVTLGDTTVVLGTQAVSSTMVGYKFRASANNYTIASVSTTATPDEIELSWVYNETTNPTASFNIFPDGYALPTDFGTQDFIKQVGYQPLVQKSLKYIESLLSDRIIFGHPEYYAIWNRKVYFYPIPSTIIQYEFHYWKDVADLILTDTPILPGHFHGILVELGIAMERERNDEDNDRNLSKAEGLINLMIEEDKESRDHVEHLGSSSPDSGITVKTTGRIPETFGHET